MMGEVYLGVYQMTNQWEVIVGNVGSVYVGNSKREAQRTYNRYVASSQTEVGRAGGEDVVLMCNGDISREYVGAIALQDKALD